MLNKKILKEMFNFTTNKNKTLKIGIIMFLQSLPYLIFYQYILGRGYFEFCLLNSTFYGACSPRTLLFHSLSIRYHRLVSCQ